MKKKLKENVVDVELASFPKPAFCSQIQIKRKLIRIMFDTPFLKTVSEKNPPKREPNRKPKRKQFSVLFSFIHSLFLKLEKIPYLKKSKPKKKLRTENENSKRKVMFGMNQMSPKSLVHR